LLATIALPTRGQPGPGYAGAQACARCHSAIHQEWAASRHNRMMQPATKQAVEGDFAQGKLVLGGSTYLLRQSNGSYSVTESDITGKEWEHRVEYTLGGRRIQHYLTTLPDGRIVLLPPTWDVIRKKWIYDLDSRNPEEAPGDPFQAWNKTCYSCHVSGGQKAFDARGLQYRTTWQNLGITCERCHGPGTGHIALMAGGAARTAANSAIVNPARLDAARSTMVCAQCHSLRDTYAAGFAAGADYYDYFLPVLEHRLPDSDDPAYWPDGRPRWLSNEALGVWQSQCFLKGGATCVTCHSRPHSTDIERNPQLGPDNNAICARCHAAIAAGVSAHSHHAARSAGSSCVECHMPAAVVSLQARMRDHSMSVPVPENTIRHGIPNACNLCHKDKDAEWALGRMRAWSGGKSRQDLVRRADAFTAARKGDPAAIPALLEILTDPSGGPWLRANAAGYLGGFPNDPAAYAAVLGSFSDPDPLVRATAAAAIRPRAAQREAAAPALVSMLADPLRTVQMSAAIALVSMGVQPFPGEDGVRFEHAKDLYRARAALNADDPQQQFAAGKFFVLAGDADGAAAAFRACLKLDPTLPARYLLAQSLVKKGDDPSARQVLQAIPREDPQFAAAQQLLSGIEMRSSGRGETPPEGSAVQGAADAGARFLEGQNQFQSEYYGAALQEFDQALLVAPEASWAVKARIDRAICLEKLARTAEAEAAFQSLAADPVARQDVGLQLAYVELLYETGRAEEAQKRIDNVIATAPKDAMAYFWRAKVLLHLRRIDQAAAAAEESIRLLPQLPDAHNLLIRIYQIQGRTREAAQQAEWLRNYHRRMESH
jgi:predicted CXXCH cytochrome family protein